ncbi:hypothetical protein A3J19_01040, partial [Candidatus Daviesbacteria bacterium RIFCSPLOWO2_02_FULL_41_8]
MGWLSYALLAVASYSVFYILTRVFLKEKSSDAIAYTIVFNFVCALLISLVSLKNGFILPDIKHYYLNFGLMAVLYTASQVLIFKASRTIGASDLIIFSSTRVLWVIGAALLFLGEAFNTPKIIGTILILISVVYVSAKKKGIKLNKGHIYALLAAFCIGIGFVNDSYILRNADTISYAALAFIFPAVLTLIVFPSSTLKLKYYLNLGILTKILLLGVFYSIGLVASYLSYKAGGNASQIVPIGQSVVIITVILAALFLGERENVSKKIIAAILVSIGVLLL